MGGWAWPGQQPFLYWLDQGEGVLIQRKRCSTMEFLIAGLVIFLGVHSTRIVAEGWRQATMERMGPMAWKGLYALASLLGLVLLVWGWGLVRQQPVVLWQPPVAMRHLAALLTLLSFVLLAAAYVPGNQIRARLGHPMVLGVKTWALAHLLANGTLADVLLFGSFLLWSVLLFAVSRRRDRLAGVLRAPGTPGATALTVAVGVLAWAAFAFWLHGALIGVRPFGR